MNTKKVSNHILLTSERYITTNNNIAPEERTFFKTLRVKLADVGNYREATDEELSQWEELKRKQAEEQEMMGYENSNA